MLYIILLIPDNNYHVSHYRITIVFLTKDACGLCDSSISPKWLNIIIYSLWPIIIMTLYDIVCHCINTFILRTPQPIIRVEHCYIIVSILLFRYSSV